MARRRGRDLRTAWPSIGGRACCGVAHRVQRHRGRRDERHHPTPWCDARKFQLRPAPTWRSTLSGV
eukprot:3739274-Prymnesium_polylepis.1